MTPINAFIAFAIGGVLYHGSKQLLGFPPTWGDYVTSVYWVGVATFAVWTGWVRA